MGLSFLINTEHSWRIVVGRLLQNRPLGSADDITAAMIVSRRFSASLTSGYFRAWFGMNGDICVGCKLLDGALDFFGEVVGFPQGLIPVDENVDIYEKLRA